MMKFVKNWVLSVSAPFVDHQNKWNDESARSHRILESHIIKLQNNQGLMMKQLEDMRNKPTLQTSTVTFTAKPKAKAKKKVKK